jgi:predicted transcriptional regulator
MNSNLNNNQNVLISLQNRQKQSYRSGTGIILEILNVVRDRGIQGAKISEIARQANLSHYVTFEKCEKLREVELLKAIPDKRNHMYMITEKGIMFYQRIEEFLETVKSIGIRI